MYAHDSSGAALSGSLEELAAASGQGCEVKIAIGERTSAHNAHMPCHESRQGGFSCSRSRSFEWAKPNARGRSFERACAALASARFAPKLPVGPQAARATTC